MKGNFVKTVPPIVTLALLSACAQGQPAHRSEDAPRAVDYAIVEKRPLENGLTVSGRLVSREEAAVASQLSGYQVARVLVDLDDYVHAGQPLATLDDTLQRSDVARQRANVVEGQVAAERADQQARRVASLDQTGVLSDEAIAERRLAAKTAGAQLGQVQAQLAAETVKSRLMIVRAPVSGRILTRSVRPGDVASPSNVMFTIATREEVELDAEIPEQHLGLVHPGQAALVTLASGATVTGRVRLVSAQVDPATRLGRARVTLPVRSDLRPGGFVQANFQVSGMPVNLVPTDAIAYSAEGASVTVIGEGNRVKTVPVKVGRQGGAMVELLSGPSSGARVLVGSQDFVLPGDRVKPVLVAREER